ncbi:MAG: hypothetical protein IJV32_08950 [Bacteroidales bacterium]|nr:hypothetical protein [Bacteroidales bacterium]
MKKLFYLAAAALMAFVACEKPEDVKEPDPDSITLISEAVVNIDAESSITTVSFKTNAAWTATVDQDFLVLDNAKGEASDEAKIKVTAQNLPAEEYGRVGNLTITAGKAEAKVIFYQGKVFIVSDAPDQTVAGGDAEFTVITNIPEYEVKIYDSFDWAPATYDKATGKGLFKVAKNEGYDGRQAYVKFTVSAIQVPVYDEDGVLVEGETQDAVYRAYVYQAGHSSLAWMKALPADFDLTNTDEPIHDATASIAKFNGKILVSDAVTVRAYDPATGEASTITIPEGLPIQSITNDDAGNLLLADLMPYLGVGKIYAIKADDTAMANPVCLIPWVNEAWSGSRGADKVAAKGDVFGNGIVTMIYGGVGSYGGLTYGLAWEIKNGVADVFDYNEYNKSTHRINNDAWLTMPELADDLWLSNRAVFVPAGPAASDGFFFSGYDGLYNLNYYDGSEWTVVAEGLGDWATAPNGMATIDWNGKKILAVVAMAYFPHWGMPAKLYIFDVTDPKNPVTLSANQYMAENYLHDAAEAATTDVILAVEGDDLTATLVDSAWGVLLKVKYPKL